MAVQNTPRLSEPVIDLIIGQLKSNFNAFLADSDNQYDDGINLEPVDDTAIYISYRYQTLKPPAIYVLMESHAFQYSNNPNWMDSNDRVLVALSSQDIDGEVLTRKAMRYGKALYGVLNQAALVSSDQRVKITLIPESMDYIQPVTDKLIDRQKEFRMDVVLTLRVLHYEKFLT